MAKAAHHRGSYQRRAKALTDAAYRNPLTQCWRCGRTLAQHPPTRRGKPQKWTAGHLVDGQVDGVLMPEASGCNYAAGARLTNTRRKSPLAW